MHWVPLVASLVAAAAITPATVRTLEGRGLVRQNYRGVQVAAPSGIAIVLSAFVALVVLAPLWTLADQRIFEFRPRGLFYVCGVAVLGLLDDVLGSHPNAPRGWRGHIQSIRDGRPSTGVAKAAGSLGLAFMYFAHPAADAGIYLLSVAVLVLATNAFNLLDLRPGRAGKAFVLLGAGLVIGAGNFDVFWSLAIWIGPILVLLVFDLQERGMLGDTGSNVIGAVAGLWLVATLSTTLGLAIAAAVLALVTLYGEFRSISAFVERTPGLRQLDLLGRLHA